MESERADEERPWHQVCTPSKSTWSRGGPTGRSGVGYGTGEAGTDRATSSRETCSTGLRSCRDLIKQRTDTAQARWPDIIHGCWSGSGAASGASSKAAGRPCRRHRRRAPHRMLGAEIWGAYWSGSGRGECRAPHPLHGGDGDGGRALGRARFPRDWNRWSATAVRDDAVLRPASCPLGG